jgi:lactoylglutathione lyase
LGDGPRLELMQKPQINESITNEILGLTHFAVSVGNKEQVDQLTERIRKDGFTIVGEPRTTGDGYYESVILDPEGNRIEITI